MERTTERGSVMPVRLLTSAPVSSWVNSPLRAWHVSPAQIFGSSAIEKPRAGFLVLHANVGQHSHCLPALDSLFFFLPQHLTFEGGIIERKERKTNH